MMTIFITVNQSGSVGLWLDEPVRNEKLHKWVGKYMYVNSEAYNNALQFVKESGLTWENDSVPINFNARKYGR